MDEELDSNALQTTEEKIKEAAKIVFLKKGFAATKTRDIAEQAGENLALINYYFRSKKNLFQLIMNEIFMEFLESSIPVFNNPETTIQQKIEIFVEKQLNLFLQQPDVPLFVINEFSENPSCDFSMGRKKHEMLMESVFHQQMLDEYGEQINPEHIMMNIVGMTLYPFLGRAMMNGMKGMDDSCFNGLMEERKKMIPIWTMSMLNGPQK
jgi:AcrR family transcriptional regulator